MRTLRKFILTVDQFIYLKRLAAERRSAPVVRIYSKLPLKEDLDDVRSKLKRFRNNFVRDITIYYDFQLKPGRASKSLQSYIKALRKYVMVEKVINTPEFERALADLCIMFSPLVPHVSEELWSGLAHFNDYLKGDTARYSVDKYCFEQKWPTTDDDYTHTIDLVMYFKKKCTYLKSIPIAKEKIVESNREELSRIAEDEFNKHNIKYEHEKELHIYDYLNSQLEIKCLNWEGDDDD